MAASEVEEVVEVSAVSYEVVDGVAHVTIERPDKRNAMDLDVFDGLAEAAGRAARDTGVGAVVVSGRHGVFSAGIDISVLGEQLQEGREPASPGGIDAGYIHRLQASFTAYEDLDVPTIAAIEGYAFGAGLQLALACHLRAVAPGAQLSAMEVEWGLVPDLGGTWRLPRLVGLGRATELAMTARRVDAEEARAIGLAELTLPAEDPQAAAHELAARLAAGPDAVRRLPQLIRGNLARGRSEALAAEAEAQLACLAGPDLGEAIAARVERREPRFVRR